MKKAAFLFLLIESSKRRLDSSAILFFYDIVSNYFSKVRCKGKDKVVQNGRVLIHWIGFLGELQTQQTMEHFNSFEQLTSVCWGIHRDKNICQAVDCFHVSARCHPYHFCKWLYDRSSDKVDLVLVNFSGRFTNTFLHNGAVRRVHDVTSFLCKNEKRLNYINPTENKLLDI